ncbi:hypothetical protein Sp245p_23540 (plasmid) [Azospirillum baldaniorum]|uniref:Phage tail collar domain-containing protein n=1 Tax=Azospirillum baldaniorum TaxID=1064539 RepID=A0A9P1NR90_9PROT|nr:tail fiber protein [Azospirillum baldaniorum]AWJ92819.1 hypothetical protein Sp245p_23540 [Azospirillum baldaniorum]TWA78237.1 tail collar domain [Azospirillum brasilense]CCD02635.1 protein of unknown function [Azospirillum baldaniorum]
MSWYKVGRVAVTNGSAAVVGTGTKWAGKFKPGDLFALAGGAFVPYEIVSVADDTHLTLATPFAGMGGDYQPYVVIQNFTTTTNADLAVRVGQLLQVYEAAVAAPEEAVAASQAAQASAAAALVSKETAADSAAAAADHALSAATSAAQAVVDTTNAIQAEAQARVAADTALSGAVALKADKADTYTKTQVDGALQTEVTTRAAADTALGNRATALESGKADKSALGTAAARNAPASGNAASGEVVLGSDSRLSDARAPTAHSVTAHSDWPAAVSVTELGCLDGVTGPIQAQINGKATVGTTAGSAAGTASAGTAATAARSDHVHPMQTSVSGNAGTATKLASAVTINNVPFDGSAGITINAADSTARIAASEKGAANGVTPLGSDGKVPASYLPSYVDDVLEFSATGNFPASGETGKIYVATGTNKTYRWSGSGYVEISASPGSTDAVPEGAANLYFTTARAAAAAPVKTVAGKSGDVALSKADVGLGSVDNTADSTKAVASAGKLTAARTITLTGGVTGSVTTDLSSAVSINATVTQDTNNRFVTDTEKATWNGKATVGSVTPSAPGAAAVGTSGQAARADHVHPAQTSVSGNAGTATKLATARTISLSGGVTGTVTFDGSANVAIAATVDPSKHSHAQSIQALDDQGMGFSVDPSNMRIYVAGNSAADEELRSYFGALSPEEAGCRVAGADTVGMTGLAPLLIGMQQGIGKLDDLQTSDTSSLVNAVNELKAMLSGGGGGGGVPPGTMMMYAGLFIPEGWLECDGSEVSRDDYPDLLEAIYETWGAGDGSTTFKLPDMRGLLAIGAGERPEDGYGVDWRQYGHVSTGDYTTQTTWTSTIIPFSVEDSSVSAIGMKYIIKT